MASTRSCKRFCSCSSLTPRTLCPAIRCSAASTSACHSVHSDNDRQDVPRHLIVSVAKVTHSDRHVPWGVGARRAHPEGGGGVTMQSAADFSSRGVIRELQTLLPSSADVLASAFVLSYLSVSRPAPIP